MRQALKSEVRHPTLTSLITGLALALSAQSGLAQDSDNGQSGASIQQNLSGYGLYRNLDLLPRLESNTQAGQFSSTDHTGANDDGFNGTYSCLHQTDAGCVIAQRKGAGEITSIWFTRNGGDVTGTGYIKIVLDGKTVLKESLQKVVNGDLGAPFVFPLVANADESSGGVYIKVPMPYKHSMKVVTENNPHFYHVDYKAFASADGIQTFDPSDKAQDVVNTFKQAGTQDPKPAADDSKTVSKSFNVPAGKAKVLADLQGPSMIRAIKMKLPQITHPEGGRQITDDGRAFKGQSQFTVQIDPDNQGVKLTRRFDAGVGNERASVFVDGQKVTEWAPKSPAPPAARWLNESVDLPASITSGKSKITITNKFISSDIDFNEFHYYVDSRLNGNLKRTDDVDIGPNSIASQNAHDYTITGQTYSGVRTFSYPQTGDNKAIAASDDVLENTRLQIRFDGHLTVNSPIGEFFGSDLGERNVRSLFFAMNTDENGWYQSWWPMPFRQTANIQLVNNSSHDIKTSQVEITTAPDSQVTQGLGPNGDTGYFHTTSRKDDTRPNHDWVFTNPKGRGKFVGVSHTMRGANDGRGYLEGDIHVYVDGSHTPHLIGTGTEDFYEGGWYFNRGTFSNPLNGNSAHEAQRFGCTHDCTGTYRLMIAGAVPFRSSLRFGIEHGPTNNVPGLYSSTAYWYGREQSNLARTDSLTLGDGQSKRSHFYFASGQASTLDSLSSKYEGHLYTKTITQPVQYIDYSNTKTPTFFRLNVDRNNQGVILRRTADQQQGGQQLDVLVNGKDVGTWYEAKHNSTKRWLDDYFLIPQSVSGNNTHLFITLKPVDNTSAPWTAAKYQAFSIVAPSSNK